jgi:glycosyltransferase involved in cell wall biosynthesis
MYYPKKGQDLLVRAVKQCRDAGLNVKATLMGGVHAYSEQSFAELKTLVQSLGISEHIEFLVNRTDVPAVLGQADLFVLPSRYEGLGLVVLEAMAAGLPVIASAVDGPAELIASEKDGLLFEPDNVEDLYQQIRRLYENPALADALTSEATSFVTRFDIHLMKNQYCDLYESLLPAAVRQRQVFNRLELSLGER